MLMINKIWSYKCATLSWHMRLSDTIIRQAGETAFIDYSGSLDWYYNPVFFVYGHYPSEALPLAVWITSKQSQTCLESWMDALKFSQTMPFVVKGPTKDLIFSCQMTMLGREGLFTCNRNRQLSSFPFSTLQSDSNFISSSNKISLIWLHISTCTIYGLIIYPFWPAVGWLDSSTGRALHRHSRGQGSSLIQVYLSLLLKYLIKTLLSIWRTTCLICIILISLEQKEIFQNSK